MYHKNYIQGNDYIINFKNIDNVEEKFIDFVYDESLARPFLWLNFTEDILCNKKITYTINTTSIISTYLIKKEESYYLFETLKKLLRLGAIHKIIYKKEFIIIHYYNEFIKNTLTLVDKWLNITVGQLLIDNSITSKVYYYPIYNDHNIKKVLDLLIINNDKKIVCYTDTNNIINNNDFINIYISISNVIKKIEIPHLKFNYIKKNFINKFLSYLN